MAPMEILALALLVIGFLFNIVGGIWFLVQMFRESVFWGILGIFCGPASLIFLFMYWEDVKNPFFVSLTGSLLILAAVFMTPDLQGSFQNADEFYQAEEFISPEESDAMQREFLQDVDPESVPAEQPAAGETTSELDAWKRLNEAAGDFYLSEVLEVDPATLNTSEAFQRYARGLQMKKDDLMLRREQLDPADEQKVADWKAEVKLLKQRSQELKAALASSRAQETPTQP